MTPTGRRRHGVTVALSLAIGAALGYVLYAGGLPLAPARLPAPAAIGGYAASLVAMHVFRAVRWRHLLRPLGSVSLRTVLATAWIGFAAVMFMPLRSGEVVRPVLLARRSEIGVWEAAGTVGAERVLDGVALSLLLGLGLAFTTPIDPLPDRIGDLALPVAAVRPTAAVALALFATLLAAVIAFHRWSDRGLRLVRGTIGRIAPGLSSRLERIVGAVARGLDFLPERRLFLLFLAETAAYWGLNAFGLWWLARGSGLPIGPLEACVVMGCLGLGILTPSAPGYFGTFQLSVFLALAMFVPRAIVTGPGAGFVFVAFLGQLGVHAAGAIVGLAGAPAPNAGAEDLARASVRR